MVALVCISHQAIVTGDFAVLGCPLGAAAIAARIRMEMADPQSFPGHVGECFRLVEQAAEYPGPALGSFVEQDLAAVVRRRQGLGTDLVILELVDGLDRLLESRLERGEDDLIEPFGRLEDQAVPPIFDEGDDTVRLGAHGIARVFLRGNLVGGLPEPLLAIEHETVALLVTASPPAEVDPPDGGCVSVDQLEEGLTVLGDLTRAALEYAAHVLEPQPAADFVTESGPFLFIAGDPIAPLGRHVLKPQEVIQELEIRLRAVLTEVIPGLTRGK